MSYLVLARKWRPKNFSEVAGQEHVLRALINALDNDRLHHAFLFSGTRGVGKTTLARIFAKSINCERGVSSTPCGECSACLEIDQGRYVDLLEVDAASRTRVDDTRELLDNVQYAPTRGRYKVYLIDEVHMLSTHSFNALLKTLEEPPAHVKFLLATTDPQKLPVTVLSRCLQFNLKRLPPAVIQGQLERIVVAEGYEHETAALGLLAAAADGSMRDGLSLLDQAIAHAAGNLSRDAVADMLGTVERTHIVRLVDALATGDGPALMGVARELHERGLGADGVLSELATLCQQIALAQAVPEALGERVDEVSEVRALAERSSAEAVQLWYQIAVNGRRDLALAPTPWLGVEMTLLRMLAFRLDGDGGGTAATGGDGATAPSAPVTAPTAVGPASPPKTSQGERAKAAPAPGADRSSAPPAGADALPSRPPPPSAIPAGATHRASVPQEAPMPTETAARAEGPHRSGAGPVEVAPPIQAGARDPVTAPTVALATAPEVTEVPPSQAPGAERPPSRSVAGDIDAADWDDFAQSLGASGMLRQLADNSVLTGLDGRTLKLQVDEEREHLITRQQCAGLERAWQARHGDVWRLSFTSGKPEVQTAARRAEQAQTERQLHAVRSLRADPYVKALQEVFGATLLEHTVQPRNDGAVQRSAQTIDTATLSTPTTGGESTPGVREAGGSA